MLKVEKINVNSRVQVNRFIRFPYKIYNDCPQWVPPILIDRRAQLNPRKHPFYEHSFADFFIATRDGEDVGTIGALEYTRFNKYHNTKKAQFYFFESIDDQEVANALFETVFEWARARGLNQVVGPKGFGALDGYGIQVEGFENRQMMTMMNYNHDYYPRLLQNLGFRKEVDFVSCYINTNDFNMPERVLRIADQVEKRGTLKVKRFKNKRELKQWAPKIGQAYNRSFVNNWEYAPLTNAEIDFVLENIITIADPSMIKIITHDDEAVGFLFAFSDVSEALQRTGGRLFPFGIIDLLGELKRTNWVSFNGAGVLPQHQGRGGNALLYAEMYRTLIDGQFEHADLTQVAETAVQMRRDLINLGGKAYKNHRVFIREI